MVPELLHNMRCFDARSYLDMWYTYEVQHWCVCDDVPSVNKYLEQTTAQPPYQSGFADICMVVKAVYHLPL